MPISDFNVPRIAVTGASGFVGRNLVGALEEAGFAVIPVSRTYIAHPSWRASPPLDRDVDPAEWKEVLKGADSVVHAAARAHVMHEFMTDPLDAFRRVNRDGVITMAKGAAAAKVRRIVFLSTVKVLGETTAGRAPFDNGDAPRPVDPYALSKAEGERALGALSQELALELLVLRPPLVYGPGVEGNLRTLMRLTARGLWFPFGTISGNRRSMISTANLSSAIIAALRAPSDVRGPLLVSDGVDLSTRALLIHLATARGCGPRLVNIPAGLLRLALNAVGQSAMAARLLDDLRVDIRDTVQQLCWRPPFTVAEGMAAMVAGEARHTFYA